MLKYFKLELVVSFTISLIDNIPTIKARIKASIRPIGETAIETFVCAISKISIKSDNKIIGKLMTNENLVDSFLSTPAKSPALIVAPEREIPGKIASPCAMPIKRASREEICLPEKGH